MNDFYCENVFSGKINIEKIQETDNVLAFYHTKPCWTTHIVIVPKKHIPSILEADLEIIKEIFELANNIIKEQKLNETNYKIITNGGTFQESKHLHFHLVSGKKNKELGE